ncbi:13043_t:CDS:1, partial [Gigaspora rosea]
IHHENVPRNHSQVTLSPPRTRESKKYLEAKPPSKLSRLRVNSDEFETS